MSKLTIGQLAKRFGLRTSALRYYEEQKLLAPAERTAAGYRLYDEEAARVLRFLQRAQRLGFSLADIRTLLQSSSLSDASILTLAEERFVELERRLTEGLVLRHELQHLLQELQDVRSRPADRVAESLFDRLLDRVCGDPKEHDQSHSLLGWLADRTDCTLASTDVDELLTPLRGRHVHIWRVNGDYHILVVGHDPAVERSLEGLVQLEAECSVHPPLELLSHKEGYLLVTRGDDAFIVARLFLALEVEKA